MVVDKDAQVKPIYVAIILLRHALPLLLLATLLLALIIRGVFYAFSEEVPPTVQIDYMPIYPAAPVPVNPAADSNANGDEQDTSEETTAATIKPARRRRRGVTLALFGLVTVSYLLDVIVYLARMGDDDDDLLVHGKPESILAIWKGEELYAFGGLVAFLGCMLAMLGEEHLNGEKSSWNGVYPMILAVLAGLAEPVLLVLLAVAISKDSASTVDLYTAFHIAALAWRVLLLFMLIYALSPRGRQRVHSRLMPIISQEESAQTNNADNTAQYGTFNQ
ncbi:uncharacterized protein L969DRAFT_44887 [Mixia osmundae IAM 14324]|uniref:Transmembrane protein n=1 Tax=Mixia osmundae (strain CBS 9802 / IAM 14324 / JCM 22182 / KY 12970) TaxID=764103 RepID=G7DY90_MIXOS|nr:uncharacterized protein L969DRAFT_44887 [Mixia osmundae IAM 14324]KEI41453.1 hypothetical protein L969DRAFT_44887 [Mixia osmundae IAM 14324]GAA95550.1 hypothetical protein E5Q_02205 [Mixia osmundae IAM 14324]